MSSNYKHVSHSSSSQKNDTGTDGLFAELDTNRDGIIDRNEFSNFITGSDTGRVSDNYGSSSYESSGYRSKNNYDISEVDEIVNNVSNYTIDTNPIWSRYGAEVRGEGLYIDSNPQLIRRETAVGTKTFEQRIQIRFFQPPPLPPPGPIIVKEVRPPQPPPLPPLRIRQEEPPAAPLPPLILRERPPHPPDPLPSETIVKHLPALPIPPRSVIIERIPAPPAPPRDIIIERWLPYRSSGERQTIVERAEGFREYAQPRNVIIQYGANNPRVVRQFQQLGVTQENPRDYLARYGEHLLDTESLIRQARAAGVIEDISVPVGITSYGADTEADLRGVSSSYSSRNFRETSPGRTGGNVVGTGYRGGFGEGGGRGFHSSTYESSSYSSGTGATSNIASTGFNNFESKF